MDDIIIASKSISEHFEIIKEVLQCIALNGLELQLSKCKFGYMCVEYLGYEVTSHGIRPGMNHLRAINKYPVPQNQKQFHSFMGLCSYFRRFIIGFSSKARPLQKLLKENVKFNFDDECLTTFELLKSELVSSPVLAIYNPARETELHCDASKIGFGASLLQRQDDGKFHPIAYFSKTTSPSEMNYHSFELETLAIVYALKRFRVYLEGIPFTIVTDCNSLTMTLGKKDINPKIWSLEFENFDYKISHRNGLKMCHVDALSRCPIVASIDSLDIDFQLRATQNRDLTLVKLRQLLEERDLPNYEMQDGLIFRKDNSGRLLFYVPKEMESSVIRFMHEKICIWIYKML